MKEEVTAESASSKTPKKKRRVLFWIILAVVLLILAFVAWIVIPIVMHQSDGSSNQAKPDGWPTSVTAQGDDGRIRSLSVKTEDGATPDLSSLHAGDKLIVTGDGYNSGIGIYVSICKIPAAGEKPSPCLGGMTDGGESSGDVDWSASTWVNNDWAWQMFGARAWDDNQAGSFTAYLLVSEADDGNLNCRVDECAIFTRADHTASGDRIQDIYLPVKFD